MNKISWEKLYAAQAPKLLGLCRRYLQDVALAEDLMHDAFLAAIQKQASYKADGPIEAWLRRITVNTILMYLRKEKRLMELALQSDFPLLDEEPDMPETDMEQILAQGFDTAELLRALDELPEHHRVVFNLYVMENYTHKQIAEALDISPGTSKSHLARARKKLQELLLKKNSIMQQKERRAVFLWFPFFKKETQTPVDNLYQKAFLDFEIPPSGNIPPRLAANLKKTLRSSPTSSISWTVKAGLGAMLVTGLASWWWLSPAQSPTAEIRADTTFLPAQSYTKVVTVPDSFNIKDTAPQKGIVAVAPRVVEPKRISNRPSSVTTAVTPQTSTAPTATASNQPVVIRRQVVRKDTVLHLKTSNQ